MEKICQCLKCGLKNWHVGNKPKLKIEQGVCEICSQSGNRTISQRDTRPLDKFFQRNKGKYDYDCIVLFTGGRDSSYSLKFLKEHYDLKILALTWDNGFFSEEHRRNIEQVTRKLEIDHQYLDVDWRLIREIYQNRLRNLGRFCNCVPLVFLFAAPFILQKKAPAVVFSTSVAQTITAITKEFGSDCSDEVLAEQLAIWGISSIDTLAQQMYEILCIDLLAGEYDKEILDMLKPFVQALVQLKKKEDISVITPSCFFEWKEKEICDSLEELGWKIGGNRDSFNHSSCMAEEVKSYLSFKQQQINMDVLEFSYLRRNQIITEEQLNSLLMKSGYTDQVPAYWKEFLKKVQISQEEMNEILQSKIGTRGYIELNLDTAEYLGFDHVEELQERVKHLIQTRILI
ncbi:adenine nucleotide alpha hydrolase family protein [[Clostridium] polysaccharolyticum]|uniref:Uncharacterized protein n=1 Tax=[Clostridium] polysaccharolyticum TaxID=29364 RepID=A0A1I0E4A5_9FIRM|nr:hypothetical protein [[Clostridium] polysaccharolyticum]SET39772.1 hypothetical protein SAMN04487772_11843 [[Clostridium] polysaccharolyticum]